MSANCPIAVVGASALFPGSIDATGFWRDILSGADRITDVPPSHWLISDYYDPDPTKPDKTYAKRGGFIGAVDFDAMGWGVPPSIVPETDTSQLLALIVAQKVLEDASAGAPDTLDRSRMSVILGVTSGQELMGSMVSRLQRPVWVKALRESGIAEGEVEAICDRIAGHYSPWKESTFPGLLGNVVAGRIANRLNLGGTNCVTDAACASTLAALAMGVSELRLGESDSAIVGGVDTMNDIFMYVCFSKTPALSLTGDCRPFSDQADGTMLGEGLGMLALKRLADAERDGDRVYAVIHGVGASSDGRAKSVYAPVPEGQALCLRRAYAQAGFGPDTVELVEAHGTGTKAGDAAEFAGLSLTFEESGRSDRQWCQLGSVKSQIGHTKSAAGAAGLFKMVMALHHKVLPPTIKVERPNPALNIESSPFHLTTRARPWVRASDHPRRGSVSSFGFGGSNFHVALEEYLPTERARAIAAPRLRALDAELVVLTGANASSIVNEVDRVVRECDTQSLPWIAHASALTFSADAQARLSIVANDVADLKSQLTLAKQMLTSPDVKQFSTPSGMHFGTGTRQGKLAFMFPGQGSQYVDMGSSLAQHFAPALAVWDAAADLKWSKRLQDVVFPRTAFGADETERQSAQLNATEWAQPAIACTSQSMLAMLAALGIVPDVCAGHSFGEVTALHAAGVLSASDFVNVARRRGELMAEAAEHPGKMVAVPESASRMRELLVGFGEAVVIANENTPTQVVLSGRVDAIDAVVNKLSALGIEATPLAVGTAFHSEVVAPASGKFLDYLQSVAFKAQAASVFGNTKAVAYPTDENAVRSLLANQLAEPVRFVEMVQAMASSGVHTFVELGPGSVLSGLVGRILEGTSHLAVRLDRKGKTGLRAFLSGLGQLCAAGHSMRLLALWDGYAAPENCTARIKPKLTIPIDGSNYGKPYPPVGGTAKLPPPNPATKHKVDAPAVSMSATAPMSTSAVTNKPVSNERAAMTKATDNGSTTRIAAPASGDWARAYQEVQRQTADAHTHYLQAMAQSHAAFLNTIEHSFLALAGAPIATNVSNEVPQSVPIAASATRLLKPTAAHVEAPSIPPVQTRTASAHAQVAAIARDAPPVAKSTPASNVDLHKLMLEIVSDRTGYPVDMLSTEMTLEGDLGIDSIKRVEILSGIQDRVPSLPKVDTAVMAKLQTLGQIVNYMNELLGAPNTDVSTPSAISSVDLHKTMLEVVADKTGYPTDMLSTEMSLEGDLGIDSIKRVEILSSMQERVPSLPKVDLAIMAKLQTLGQIVNYMNDLLTGTPAISNATAPAAARAPAPAAAAARAPQLCRYILRTVPRSSPRITRTGWFAGRVVVTNEGTALTQVVVDALQLRGVQAHAVDEVPTSDVRGVVFLGGLRNIRDVAEAIEVNREAFRAARSFAASGTDVGAFATVQDTGGTFATSGTLDPNRAWLAGCAGLARSVAREWSDVAAKAIDLERGQMSVDELAVKIVNELLEGGADIDVGLPAGGRRLVLESAEVAVKTDAPLPLSPGDVVVASGGARGVTAATLIGLAREMPLSFVLLGRSALNDEPVSCAGIVGDADLKSALLKDAKVHGRATTPAAIGAEVNRIRALREIRATLSAIEEAGSKAQYVTVDVSNAIALSTALEGVRASFGPIAAVVHGAGVLADKLVVEKTDEQFDRVFDTKVQGLRALLDATANDSLKALILFSSVAARVGNVGQTDYAMANEVLNKVAQCEARRRGDGCLVRALGWGPWEGGMVSPDLRTHFERMGVALIPLNVGTRMLLDELRGRSQAGVELVLGGAPTEGGISVPPSRALSFDVRIEASRHGYLFDHAIDGNVVVPIVMAIEWFSRAARAFAPTMHLARLTNVQVLRGIVLRDFQTQPKLLRVQCRHVVNGSDLTLALELTDERGIAFYRAKAELSYERRMILSSGAGRRDLALGAWGERVVYDGHALFHGPAFRAIAHVEGVSATSAAACMTGIADANWGEEFVTDALAFDGGLQLAVLWCKEVLGAASLPTSIRAVDLSGPPLHGPIHCVLSAARATEQRSECDLTFRDAGGRVLAVLSGVETHLRPQAQANSAPLEAQ